MLVIDCQQEDIINVLPLYRAPVVGISQSAGKVKYAIKLFHCGEHSNRISPSLDCLSIESDEAGEEVGKYSAPVLK